MTLFIYRILGIILALIYFPIFCTLGFKRSLTNFQKHWEKENRPMARCGWHEHILAFVYRYAFRKKISVMASKSKDGEIIASALKMLKLRVVRGSSTRGGSYAFRSMLKACKEGYSSSLMVDGPKGPHRVLKPGIILLASMAGTPIVPTIIVVKWFIRVNSWDQMIIPIPFSPTVELNGRPIMVPKKPSEVELKNKLMEVENELKRLDKLAENVFRTRREWNFAKN